MPKKLGLIILLLSVYTTQTINQAVYLVPWDYSGPISSYYREWGGTKPHCTLAGFVPQPKTLNSITSTIARNSRAKIHWTLQCSKDHCNLSRSEGLRILHFSARTIKNIMSAMRTKKIKDMHNQNSTHFTLCKVSETRFNTTTARRAMERAHDWRLVIVESARLNSKKIWKNSYKI